MTSPTSSALSRKCYSESLQKVSLDYKSNKQIVLQAMSKLVLEDEDYIEHTITKIANQTNLSHNAICEVFKDIRQDDVLIEKIHIDGIAEGLE